MRNFLGFNNGEKKAKLTELRETLEDNKRRVSDELNYYKSVARDIKKAKKQVEAAEAAYAKRESDKNAARLEQANDELTACIGSFRESDAQIKQILEAVHSDYSQMADQYGGRKADKIMDAFEKYNSAVLSRMIDIQSETETDGYFESDTEEDETMAIPEIPVANGTPNPAAAPQQAPAAAPAYAPGAYQYPQYIPVPMPMPSYGYAPQQQQEQPSIAPVSIDVSPMLEKALEATLEKFVAAFDKKIEKFVDEHPVDIPVSGVAVAGGNYSGEVAALEEIGRAHV